MATPEQLAALRSVVPAAQASAWQYGVPASVTLAQWILESAWGNSGLALECHNYFGIKAQAGQDCETYATHEVVHGQMVGQNADFAWYPNAAAGIAAHAKFLATLPRYAPAMADKTDIVAFCYELQRCGYSTSPTYARSLLDLIREHNLTQYDKPAAPAAR